MEITNRKASFSRCKTYRYWLSRQFSKGSGHCVFIGLNPSIADVNNDDPTIRRCMGFASDWGYQKLTVVNLFAFRTPSPEELKRALSPEGTRNRGALREACQDADCIVAAWGVHGTFLAQSSRLSRIWTNHRLQCFGVTKNGQPIHPLYQPRNANLHAYKAS